jgi:hypothetical protein
MQRNSQADGNQSAQTYRVSVRMENGAIQTLSQDAPPTFKPANGFARPIASSSNASARHRCFPRMICGTGMRPVPPVSGWPFLWITSVNGE